MTTYDNPTVLVEKVHGDGIDRVEPDIASIIKGGWLSVRFEDGTSQKFPPHRVVEVETEPGEDG